MSLNTENMPKYATVLAGGVCKLGDGASTVGATALGVDGIAADAKVCYTAGSHGGIVESLSLCTNDTAAVNVFVYGLLDGVVHPFGIVPVPASSGNLGTALNVDGLNSIQGLPKNAAGMKYLPLRTGMSLKVAVLAAMTANKVLIAKTTGVDFAA